MRFAYDLDIFYEVGITIPINLDLDSHPHALLTGGSGSGKSYSLLYLLGQMMKSYPNIVVYFCDFKNSDDFNFLSTYPHYYSGDDCYNGIISYYNEFVKARKTNQHTTRYVLICDEYPSFINYLQMQDKLHKTKKATDILSTISELLMLGRGLNFGIWLVTQRADNTLFANGSRDNFMIIIALGRLSREQKGMLFAGEDLPEYIYQKGEGILYADGEPIRSVKFPYIENIENLKKHIIDILLKKIKYLS